MDLSLRLSPHGRLYVLDSAVEDSSPLLGRALTGELGVEAFARSSAEGLLALAQMSLAELTESPSALFWRGFAFCYLERLAHSPEVPEGEKASPLAAPREEFVEWVLRIPAMPGAEYASLEVFAQLWREFGELITERICVSQGRKSWLQAEFPALSLLGKVTFHLAENKRTPATPFAFMATYTHRLSAQENPVHLPLARALQEYAGKQNQDALRSLLEPVQRASEKSGWVRKLLDSRRVFQPQAWTPKDAYEFLREVSVIEQAGIITRIPNWWKGGRGLRPAVRVTVGGNPHSVLGLDTMLDFSVETSLGGETLSADEWRQLMAAGTGLVHLRGQWVEADSQKLQEVLNQWRAVQRQVGRDGISFLDGMRLLSGLPPGDRPSPGGGETRDTQDWSEVTAGGWMKETLERLHRTDGSPAASSAWNDQWVGRLQATLRPYQVAGSDWLWFLQNLGLGACLADDMGLGKTIQVIALLLRLKHEPRRPVRDTNSVTGPALLIVPASLLGNWKNELSRFAPSLRVVFAHPAETPSELWRTDAAAVRFLREQDLLVTTYGQTLRLPWLKAYTWDLLVIDEAQAIKNPGARQTRALKALRSRARIALSGTPIENRLGDLWSLYDFLNPGLLGNGPDFSRLVKGIQKSVSPDFSPLRRLVRPYLLRRLKTDRSVITDLPDKTEMTAWCSLTKPQAVLYQKSVRELEERLEESTDGIQRRGLVLSFLMRFKQICNHPTQWTGLGGYPAGESGKFLRLSELTEEMASRQEKVLVFTQFRELTLPLETHLRPIFGRAGLTLDGTTSIKQRQQRVADFQRDDGPPFFVLSLKAGGTGLNLTAANHVIHFDRWWNPAIENQATDRAFRIGQKKNVLVQKFVCRGTVEERIDRMILEKKQLAESVLGSDGGAEKILTEMSNSELIKFVSLDLNSVGADEG